MCYKVLPYIQKCVLQCSFYCLTKYVVTTILAYSSNTLVYFFIPLLKRSLISTLSVIYTYISVDYTDIKRNQASVN